MILVADNILRFFWFPKGLKMVRWNLFFWILVPLRGEGSCVCGCGQSSLYMQVLHFTILNPSKNTVFFLCNIDLRRTMLPNYLGTYSSDLCPIWDLEEAVEQRKKCQSYHKSWVFGSMHLIGQNKQSTFRCNVPLQQRLVLSNAAKLLGDLFLSLVPNLSLKESIWEGKKVQKLS